MIFIPTEEEEQYLNEIETSSHGELVFIRMTTTMLEKSIIDASHPVRLLLKENLNIDYSEMGRGAKNGFKSEVQLLVNGEFQTRVVSYYRPETKNGDPRFWISRLHNEVSPFDMIVLTVWNEQLYAIPLTGEIQIFSKALKDTFITITEDLPVRVRELQDYIKSIHNDGWVKTLKGGDTGVGFTFESLIGIGANSSPEPDYHGIEIKCSRGMSSTLQTLFSKTPNYGDLKNKRKDLVVNHGYWDADKKRYALYMTIKATGENSRGWQLKFDYKESRIYITKDNKNIVFYEYDILRESLSQKHKQTVFIKALSKDRNSKNDKNEKFLYDSAFYCEESSFINFVALMEEGKISLDFAIHHDPETGKTRDHGFLWRIGKDSIPLLFKKQISLCIKDTDC